MSILGKRPPGAAWLSFVLLAPFVAGLALSAETPSPPAAAADPDVAILEPAPRLEIDVLEVQLGEIVRGQIVEARFELRNTGSGTLRIERAKPG